MLKVIVADDEPIARERLCNLLKRHADVSIVGEAENGEEVLQLCRKTHPSVLFLDIRMPGLSGLDVADIVRQKDEPMHIVFVTAFDQHAIEAFDLDATDYLTKPVRPTRLDTALERVRRNLRQPARSERIGLPVGNRTEIVRRDQIMYAAVVRAGLEVHCTARVYPLAWNLKQLQQGLTGDDRFLRISRQAIVNLEFVQSISPADSGTSVINMNDGTQLEVSRTATKQLKGLF